MLGRIRLMFGQPQLAVQLLDPGDPLLLDLSCDLQDWGKALKMAREEQVTYSRISVGAI